MTIIFMQSIINTVNYYCRSAFGVASEMTTENTENVPGYVEKAVDGFKTIIAANQKDMLEDMTRANKGELFVLHFLSMREAAVLPSELSMALHSSAARISALLGSLEKKGQIEREIDKSNRRNILVTITASGREYADAVTRRMDENLARVFVGMGEADATEFLRLLERFFQLMHKQMAEGRSQIK